MDRTSEPIPATLADQNVDSVYAEAKTHFAADEAAVRQRLFKFEPLYSRVDVRMALARLFSDKCAFCESKVEPAAASPITHHFRPKQEAVDGRGRVSRPHYWWLAYEWDNLYLSCQRCARAAGAQFPVAGDRARIGVHAGDLLREKPLLVDPCQDDPKEA